MKVAIVGSRDFPNADDLVPAYVCDIAEKWDPDYIVIQWRG